MNNYPLQSAAITALERVGYRFVCWFNAHNPEDENAQCATMQRRFRGRASWESCEVDTDGSVNGQTVEAFIAANPRVAR